MADNLDIIINAKLNTTQTTQTARKQIKQVEAEINKTPMQLRIESSTGVLKAQAVQATKEYKAMYSNIIREHEGMQKAISKTESNTRNRIQQIEKTQSSAQNKNLEQQYEQKQKLIRLELEQQATAQKRLETLRLEAQEYIKITAEKLKGLSTKYSYGNQSTSQQMQKELNNGMLNFKSIDSIPAKLQVWKQQISQIENELKASHQKNINLLNEQIAKEQQSASKKLTNAKLIEQAQGKQANLIDEGIRLRRLEGEQQSSLLRNQMQQQQAERQRTFELGRQIALFKEQKAIQMQNLQSTYGSSYNSPNVRSQVSGVQSSIANLNAGNFHEQSERINTDIGHIRANLNEARAASNSFANDLFHNAYKMLQWAAVGTAIFGTWRALQDGVQYITQLDTALNEIRIVTGKTQLEVEKLASSYNNLAKEMSVTTTEIASTAVSLYRQGLSEDNINERMQAIIKYAKISGISLKEADTIITASANGTKASVNEIIDVFSYLGDATATGADEIGKAFQRSASVASIAGVDYKKLASYIAVVSSTTRVSAETIGNSMRSLMIRYQAIKENGFNAEDATNINQVTKALEDVSKQTGFSISAIDKSSGMLRNYTDVLDDLSKVWDDLNPKQKAYLQTALAGNYQGDKFAALMENYTRSIALYEGSLVSAGTAQEKFNIWQEGTQSKLDGLKAVWEGLTKAVLNSGFFKAVISGVTGILDGLSTLTGQLSLAVFSFTLLTIAAKAFTTQITAASLAIKGFVASVPVIGWIALAISALIPVVLGFASASKRAREEQEKLSKQTLEEVQTSVNKLNIDEQKRRKLDELVKSYDDLKKSSKGTKEEEDTLHSLQVKMVALYPNLADGIDSVGDAYTNNIEKIRNFTKEQKSAYIQGLDQQKQILGFKMSDFKIQESSLIQKKATMLPTKNKILDSYGNLNKTSFSENELKDVALALGYKSDFWSTADSKLIKELGGDYNIKTIKMQGYGNDQKTLNKDAIKRLGDIAYNKYSEVDKQLIDVQGQIEQFNNLDTTIKELQNPKAKANNNDNIPKINNIYNQETLKQLLDADKISLSTYVSQLEKIKKDKFGSFIGKDVKALNAMLLDPKTKEETEKYLSLMQDINGANNKDKKGSSTGQSFDEKYVKEYNAEVDKSVNKIKHLTNELDVLNASTSNYREKHKKVNEILDEQKNKLEKIHLASEKLKGKKSDLESQMIGIGINPNWSESKKNNIFDSWDKNTDKRKLFNELYKDWQETSNGIIQNDDAYFSTVKEIFANRKQLVDNQVKQVEDYQSKRIAKNELLLKQSQGHQSLLKEGTPEYSKEIDVQVNLHKEKQKILEDEAERLKKILATNKNLTEEDRNQIQQKIDARSSGWWDEEQNISSLIKKRQEDELKYVEDAQNAMMDIRRKAGEEEKRILEKDLKTYTDNIDKKIKALDDLIDKENYDTSIQNQDKDINKKQAEIDALALDNSAEGLARKAQLEMDLADLKSKKDDDIRKHSQDEEKKTLQNLKDVESKKVEEKKSAIDEQLSDAKLFNTVQLELTNSTVDQIIDEYEKMAKAVGGNYDTMIEKAKFFNTISAAKKVVNDESSAYHNPTDITKDYNEASGKDVNGKLIDKIISLKEQYEKATTASQRTSIRGEADSIRTQLPSDVAQRTSELNTEELKKYKEDIKNRVYKNGGLVDFTGAAWLDGSKSNPEYVLKSMDFTNLLKIVDITKTIMPMINTNMPNLASNNSNKNVTVQSTVNINGIPSESVDGLLKRIKSEVWTDMWRKLAIEGK